MSIRPCLVVVAVVPLVGLLLAGCGGGSLPQERTVAPAHATTSEPDGSDTPVGALVVDVAGLVRRPGVYELEAGARVHEAIEAAGGLRGGADVSGLNRAAPLTDGQQVLVPARASGGTASAGGAPGARDDGAGGGAQISINQADAATLDELPGVGPVTAQRIVDERESGGPFASVDDLDRVSGIGPATIEALREVATT